MAGFVKTNFEVKLIILYILNGVERPITFDELSRAGFCDPGVNYFSLKQSVEELMIAKNIEKTEDFYTITPRGYENFTSCSNTLPPSLLAICDREIHLINEEQRKAGQTYAQSSVNENEDSTYTVRLAIVNEKFVFLELKYIVASRSEADQAVTAFQANPNQYYEELMKKLKTLHFSQGKP